jgi:glutathione S-transferase
LNERQNNGEDDASGPLLPQDFVQELRTRWDSVQAGFVDEPRTAVQHADELVASAIKRLTENFAEARNKLEAQWSRGDEVNTEELRVALKKYRTFFQKLMSV